jgi:hypothetical protein
MDDSEGGLLWNVKEERRKHFEESNAVANDRIVFAETMKNCDKSWLHDVHLPLVITSHTKPAEYIWPE